jgi:hypothetical protein
VLFWTHPSVFNFPKGNEELLAMDARMRILISLQKKCINGSSQTGTTLTSKKKFLENCFNVGKPLSKTIFRQPEMYPSACTIRVPGCVSAVHHCQCKTLNTLFRNAVHHH